MTTLQKVPQASDIVEIEGKRIRIVEMVGQRISKVKLEKLPEPAEVDKSRIPNAKTQMSNK